jgi:FkbM family methyltransferase
MISLRQPVRLWDFSRQLCLGLWSTVNLFGVYYFGRREWLRKLYPRSVVIEVPNWGKVRVRPNGYDYLLMDLMFVRHDYQLQADGVRTILDLGANIGMASVYFNRLFPSAEIACVEPSPQNLPILKDVLALNQIRCRVFDVAIGSEEGEIDLYLAPNPADNSSAPSSNHLEVVRVPQMSVPQVMQQMGWDRIDLLKLDVEGAEKFVLTENNSWLQNVRHIVGESHVGIGYSYSDLKRDLGKFDFACEAVIEETETFGATFRAVRPSTTGTS